MTLLRHILASIAAATLAGTAQAEIDLQRIMADPAWIGAPIEAPYWSADGHSVYYRLKRADSSVRDLHRIDLAGAGDVVVDGAALAAADGTEMRFDRARRRAVFVRDGDIFLRELAGGTLRQLTRTEALESAPRFSVGDDAVHFRVENQWFVYRMADGLAARVADLRLNDDPALPGKADMLRDMQLRLFSTLRRQRDDREMARRHDAKSAADNASRSVLPWYLGDKLVIADSALSPSGRWLMLVTTQKSFEGGQAGKMPKYVTESGYEEIEEARTRVGRNGLAPQRLLLLDLSTREKYRVTYDKLPGIYDEPLAALPAAQDSDKKGPDGKSQKKTRKARQLLVTGMFWSPDGKQLAVQLLSTDNKDRWLATVDFETRTLVPQHRLSDTAWVNWNFNEFGWLPDSRALWLLSEQSGFAHLYLKALDQRKAKALSKGRFEVSAPVFDAHSQSFYLRANREQPYDYEIYRLPLDGGAMIAVTELDAVEAFALAPDGKSLWVSHSQSYTPLQLSMVDTAPDGGSRQLTDTRSAEYRALNWLTPEIVAIPASKAPAPIFSKFYAPTAQLTGQRRAAVLFIHGAGYLQNTHLGFPYYFREQMFHNLLVEKGYLVLDMDYRASAGYGRDWRTAIYRQMGTAELDDLADGVRWLVEKHNADPQRIGIYGGSYGGFLTLMALFTTADRFAAGAALRPVTDWTQYDHEYTSKILNTPERDPEAHRNSSPIEFAAGLQKPLLICHGMLDDNVFYQDSVRLAQRLIELGKDNWELASYPLEGHSFVHPEAWRDEYRRILHLFERHLR